MNIGQVKRFYENKKDKECPITEQLVKAGYQQKSGGYIDCASICGGEDCYKNGIISQGWHLMLYCKGKEEDAIFGKRVKCGELIIWMSEVGECVEKRELQSLVDEIIKSDKPYDRAHWNQKIQELCFDKIATKVEQCL